MRRIQSWLLAGSMIAALLAAAAVASDSGKKTADFAARESSAEFPQAAVAAEETKPTTNSVVTEITEIRNQQGSILSGSFLESTAVGAAASGSDADEFQAALQRIASQSGHAASSAIDGQHENPARPDAAELEASEADQLVDLLRATSRALDARSHDLEAQRQFDRADELHRLAQRLRLQARRLESGE